MKTENGVKTTQTFERNKKTGKYDARAMSDKTCPICGHPLKQNKVVKGHKLCYVCNKVVQGKNTNNAGRNFLKEQYTNILEYKGIEAARLHKLAKDKDSKVPILRAG